MSRFLLFSQKKSNLKDAKLAGFGSGAAGAVRDDTQYLNETESKFFPIPNCYDTESDTFFDTIFFSTESNTFWITNFFNTNSENTIENFKKRKLSHSGQGGGIA